MRIRILAILFWSILISVVDGRVMSYKSMAFQPFASRLMQDPIALDGTGFVPFCYRELRPNGGLDVIKNDSAVQLIEAASPTTRPPDSVDSRLIISACDNMCFALPNCPDRAAR
jgi:hypothetical protein